MLDPIENWRGQLKFAVAGAGFGALVASLLFISEGLSLGVALSVVLGALLPLIVGGISAWLSSRRNAHRVSVSEQPPLGTPARPEVGRPKRLLVPMLVGAAVTPIVVAFAFFMFANTDMLIFVVGLVLASTGIVAILLTHFGIDRSNQASPR